MQVEFDGMLWEANGMRVIKCPRCEVNFIKEEDGFCAICKKEMKGEMPKEEPIEICMECGEHPCLPGQDFCVECLKSSKVLPLDVKDSLEHDHEPIDSQNEEMDESDLAIDEPSRAQDIPDRELEQIHKELGMIDSDDDQEDDEDEFDGFYEEDIEEMRKKEHANSLK